ncbi:MAG: pilus assembly protein PilE [Azoarcus sp.]|nr:pilus assembly protein PilE [Azoarcus sp.]
MAIPNYQSYMIRTRRATAAACLLEIAQSMERFYTVNLSYKKDKAKKDFVLKSSQCQTDLTGYYTFSATPDTRTYTLSAVPQSAQKDKDPAKCGTLTLDQTGKKGAGTGADVSTCWK